MSNKIALGLLMWLAVASSACSINPTTSLPIPSKVTFAGQTISLERNDLRERYDREQIVIAYNHSVTTLQIKRANKFFPIIEPILKQYGVPDDFKYLAVIESNLDPRVQSGAGAAGLWQLMPKTAEQLGLEVNDEVDERYHIEKSTVAACKYFKSAYNKFKDWATVAASYNAGMGRVGEEQDQQQTDEVVDLYLNPETGRYIFRLIAIKQFMENPKSFGYQFSREDFYQTVRTKDVTVKDSVGNWTTWAKQNGISYAQLKEYNLWLRNRKLTNTAKKEYKVQLPEKADLIFTSTKINIHNPMWVFF